MGKPLNHKPAANTAAVITIPASQGARISIESLMFSYDAAPIAGEVTIESPAGTLLYHFYVTSAGPGPVLFGEEPLETNEKNAALIVTLAAGGGSTKGSLSLLQTR